jgi:hypothetical protein
MVRSGRGVGRTAPGRLPRSGGRAWCTRLAPVLQPTGVPGRVSRPSGAASQAAWRFPGPPMPRQRARGFPGRSTTAAVCPDRAHGRAGRQRAAISPRPAPEPGTGRPRPPGPARYPAMDSFGAAATRPQVVRFIGAADAKQPAPRLRPVPAPQQRASGVPRGSPGVSDASSLRAPEALPVGALAAGIRAVGRTGSVTDRPSTSRHG